MKNLTHINFTQNSHSLQLKMQFDVATIIPKDSKVRLVCKIVEEMNVDSILSTYSVRGRKPAVDPIVLLKILLFCYSEGIYSCRKIEDFCTYDTRALYLLQGTKAPDHTTINRFRNVLESSSADLLNQFVELLIDEGHVDLKNLYIDGTKIEAISGRYTFVWKKAVENYRKKLAERVVQDLELPKDSDLASVIQSAKQHFNAIRNQCSASGIVFVHGIGKRKHQLQRDYEYFKDVLKKFKRYDEHLEIMGDRNSYSKTDHDATFMRMKEDHMMNGQLKPAYNIQLASSGAFIVGVMGSQKSNDMHTMKPFLERLLPEYKKHLKNIVTDAGYESVENYNFLKKVGLTAFIKPSNYETGKTRKSKSDIGKRENMTYLENEDAYICKMGKRLNRLKDKVKTYASGFRDTIHSYGCYECMGCPYNIECTKSKKSEGSPSKTFKYSPDFERYRRESYMNITTDEGIKQRMNRSIQAEGMFSKLKDGLKYDRFRHKGMKRIVSDLTLMSIGINLNKLHSKLLKGQEGVIEYKKQHNSEIS